MHKSIVLISDPVECRGIESSTPGAVDGDISMLKVNDVDAVFCEGPFDNVTQGTSLSVSFPWLMYL